MQACLYECKCGYVDGEKKEEKTKKGEVSGLFYTATGTASHQSSKADFKSVHVTHTHIHTHTRATKHSVDRVRAVSEFEKSKEEQEEGVEGEEEG